MVASQEDKQDGAWRKRRVQAWTERIHHSNPQLSLPSVTFNLITGHWTFSLIDSSIVMFANHVSQTANK